MRDLLIWYIAGLLTLPIYGFFLKPLIHATKWACIDTYNFVRWNDLNPELPRYRWIDAPFRIFWGSFKETLKSSLQGWERTL